MQQWIKNLSRNEQLMLLVGAVVIVLYILFVVILQPMSGSVAALENKNQVAEESLQNVKALAAEYKALNAAGFGSSGGGNEQNLTRLIDSTVKKNQLAMSRFQPSSSGDVQVRFENAAFSNILAWLNELETDNGVLIRDLSVTNGSAVGLVNVSVRVRQGV